MEAKANHLSRPALSCSGEKYTRSELKIKPNLFWSLSSTLDVFNTEILATHYVVLSNIQAANIATLANFIFPVIHFFFFFFFFFRIFRLSDLRWPQICNIRELLCLTAEIIHREVHGEGEFLE